MQTKKKELEPVILEMSKRMSIVSSITSFIAVEKRDLADIYTGSGMLTPTCTDSGVLTPTYTGSDVLTPTYTGSDLLAPAQTYLHLLAHIYLHTHMEERCCLI